MDKTSQIFAVKMYQLAAAQQTSTAKLAAFFQKFLKKVRLLRVKNVYTDTYTVKIKTAEQRQLKYVTCSKIEFYFHWI